MIGALHLISYNIPSLGGTNFVLKNPIDICMYFPTLMLSTQLITRAIAVTSTDLRHI
jgi:hypothetical protein